MVNFFIPMAVGVLISSIRNGAIANCRNSRTLIVLLLLAIILDSVNVYRRYNNYVR